MDITVKPFDALSQAELQSWLKIHQQVTERQSPYFHPDLSALMHELNGPVEVVVMTDGDKLGFLPFHRIGRLAYAVGHPMNDYEGVIAEEGLQVPPISLLSAMKVSRWRIRHLFPCESPPWNRYVVRPMLSPVLDVSGGMKAFKDRQDSSGTGELRDTRRKTRKIEREIGELNFTMCNNDVAWLDQMIEWKRMQYLETGAEDNFSVPWRRELLVRLLQRADSDLRLVMSTLSVAGEPLAVHVGMQSGSLMHSWFPAYDNKHYRYSPGRLLMAMIIEHADEDAGIRHIDLGKGEAEYKTRLMTSAHTVGEGIVDSRHCLVAIHRSMARQQDRMRNSAGYNRLRNIKRKLLN